jgi:hypothetical protein
MSAVSPADASSVVRVRPLENRPETTVVAKATKKSVKSASPTVTVDRRKPKTERRVANEPVATGMERRKVQRRRQIDPTTCERDYSDAEVEFMRAMDDYKRANGRMFPTCSEILEVIAQLGYEKRNSQPAVATADQMGDMQSLSRPTLGTAFAPAVRVHPATEDAMMEPYAV